MIYYHKISQDTRQYHDIYDNVSIKYHKTIKYHKETITCSCDTRFNHVNLPEFLHFSELFAYSNDE